jgi:hypothetical protein
MKNVLGTLKKIKNHDLDRNRKLYKNIYSAAKPDYTGWSVWIRKLRCKLVPQIKELNC